MMRTVHHRVQEYITGLWYPNAGARWVYNYANPCSAIIHTQQERNLIAHVRQSIEQVNNGYRLPESVLTIPGGSSPKVRSFLNRLCSLPHNNYLEIGLWQGSTFISALHGNDSSVHSAIGIDNWSQFGGKAEFLGNVKQHLTPGIEKLFQVYDHHSFTIDKSVFTNPVNIYFYDGDHAPESHEKAYTYFNDVLDSVFITVIDDWGDARRVRPGTFKAFAKLKYEVLFEQSLPTYHFADTQEWWNGLYVAVIRKPTKA